MPTTSAESQALAILKAERERLTRLIEIMESPGASPVKKSRRGKRRWTAEQKQALSEKTKQRWAARKKKAKKKTS